MVHGTWYSVLGPILFLIHVMLISLLARLICSGLHLLMISKIGIAYPNSPDFGSESRILQQDIDSLVKRSKWREGEKFYSSAADKSDSPP